MWWWKRKYEDLYIIIQQICEKMKSQTFPGSNRIEKINILYKQITMKFENIKKNILKASREKQQNIDKENRLRLI